MAARSTAWALCDDWRYDVRLLLLESESTLLLAGILSSLCVYRRFLKRHYIDRPWERMKVQIKGFSLPRGVLDY